MSAFDQALSPAEYTRLIGLARQDAAQHLGGLLHYYRGFLRRMADAGIDDKLSRKVDVSDLVQDTYFEAARDFSNFRGTSGAELRAWLRQIMNRSLLNTARHNKSTEMRDVQREVSIDALGSEAAVAIADMVDNTATPHFLASSQECQAELLTKISQLPENRRRAIGLRSLERRSFQEVGDELGISGDAARKLWSRAIEELSQSMRPQ